MKPFFWVLVFVLAEIPLKPAAFAQAGEPPASASQAVPVDQQNALRAKSLLEQMIQALGGQNYLNIEDISQEGRTYSFHLGRPNSAGTVFWRFYRFPDKDRMELTKKRDVIEIFNGDKGYEITYKGTRPNDEK
jgi:hypothetical protein